MKENKNLEGCFGKFNSLTKRHEDILKIVNNNIKKIAELV